MKPTAAVSIHQSAPPRILSRLLPLAEWPDAVTPPARLAALDIGVKTIGIALATPDWQIVTPLATVTRSKWALDVEALGKAMSGFEIKGLIVGLPLHMDGSEGRQAQSVKQTVYNLMKAAPLWLDGVVIGFQDERLSTNEALDRVHDDGLSSSRSTMSRGKAKQRGALDALAAQIILESALQTLTNNMKKD